MTASYESDIESDTPFMTGESDEAYDEASEYDESEGRRQRGRRLTPAQVRKQQLLARRKWEMARRRSAPALTAPAPSAPQVAAEVRQTRAAVEDVQLETGVLGDDVRRALAAKRKDTAQQNLAFALSQAVQQLLVVLGDTGGPLASNPVKIALIGLPALALPSAGKGWTGNIKYPFLAATLGIAVGDFFFEQSKQISVVEFVSPPTPTTVSRTQPLFQVKAIAKNKRGNVLSDVQPVITALSGTTSADPDPQTGLFTVATSPPTTTVVIKATAKDKTAAPKEVTAQLTIQVI